MSNEYSLNAKKDLVSALIAAQADAESVAKDGKVDFGRTKYTYATAEAILAYAPKLLAKHGLVLMLESHMIEGDTLISHFDLAHSSGQSRHIMTHTPIVAGSGQARDKAAFAAQTFAHRYTLRNILHIPQADPSDDINQRDDSRQPVRRSSGDIEKLHDALASMADQISEERRDAIKAEVSETLGSAIDTRNVRHLQMLAAKYRDAIGD